MVTRTEAFTYLLRGIAVSLCLFCTLLAEARDYRQYPTDNGRYTEKRTYPRRRTPKRHISEGRPSYKRPSAIRTSQKKRSVKKSKRKYRHAPGRKKTVRKYSRSRKKANIVRYRIRRGDTLYSLARRYKTTVSAIRRVNGMSSRQSIKFGQILRIPRGGSSGAATRGVVYRKKKPSGKKARPAGTHPPFRWPMLTITGYSRDSAQGVRPIGLLIKSRPNAVVRSSASGTVRHIGYMRGYGNFIVIQHQGRYMTVYANLDHIAVSRGTRIRRGGLIGRIGNDRTLHFQIDYAGKPKNPLKYLPRKRG